MKKNRMVLIVMLMLAVLLVGCEEKAKGTDSKEGTEETFERKETTLEELEAYLLDAGVLSGEKTEVDAEMMRAEDGFKYADSHVEIYEYDVNSSVYDSLAAGSSVGFSDEYRTVGPFTADAVNGKYVLISTGEVSKELRNAFGNFNR